MLLGLVNLHLRLRKSVLTLGIFEGFLHMLFIELCLVLPDEAEFVIYKVFHKLLFALFTQYL